MKSKLNRRNFLRNASMGIGAGAIGLPASLVAQSPAVSASKSMVTVGTVSVMDLSASSTPEMIQKVLNVMEQMVPYNPDIICLPEVFAFTNITNGKSVVKDVAEKAPGPVISPFSKFAAIHKCYVVCPTYTTQGGNIYISAVLLDRNGNVQGEYHKMRPTTGEMETGISPGEIDPPVFETDFGKIGIQICFDIKYEEGWKILKDKGAQIIFWPSAYAAGKEIASMAWRHQVYIVSSTQKDTSKLCDITGETIAETNRWQKNWVCGKMNLEKAFIATWPAVSLFSEIQKKYGPKLSITTYGEEEWTIIESVDPDVKVADVLKEFNLKPLHDSLADLAVAHQKARSKA